MPADAAAARGGGAERRPAPGVAAEAAGTGPGHLQVHQHLRDPRVLHPAGGGQRRLRPDPHMRRRHGNATEQHLQPGFFCFGLFFLPEPGREDFRCFQSVHTLCTDCALNFF